MTTTIQSLPPMPDPATTPVLTVEQAAELLVIGRSLAYRECRRYIESGGAVGIPAIRIGRLMRCPTHAVLELCSAGVPPAA